MNFSEFKQSLPKIKNIPLLGETSHFKMVPPFRQEVLRNQAKTVVRAKQASVMALFYPNKHEQTQLVFILRKTYKGVHSAQVGFPGGKPEPVDNSLKEAALRETEEEIGVPANEVKVVKALSKVYIPPSNFHVQPFLGITEFTPKFIKQENEVETIIEVDLEQVLDNRCVMFQKVKTSYNTDVEVPAFLFNGHVVWGATAMMLSEIKDILKQLW